MLEIPDIFYFFFFGGRWGAVDAGPEPTYERKDNRVSPWALAIQHKCRDSSEPIPSRDLAYFFIYIIFHSN